MFWKQPASKTKDLLVAATPLLSAAPMPVPVIEARPKLPGRCSYHSHG